MSSELFISRTKQGEIEPFSKSKLIEKLKPYIIKEEPEFNLLHVNFSKNIPDGGQFYLTEDKNNPENLLSLAINRVTGRGLFWDYLYDFLKSDNYVLYWPGSHPIVGLADTISNLPIDMIKSLGDPITVHSGKEILDLFK